MQPDMPRIGQIEFSLEYDRLVSLGGMHNERNADFGLRAMLLNAENSGIPAAT